jgi:hypothetical protein
MMVGLAALDLCRPVELLDDQHARPFVQEGEPRERPQEVRALQQLVGRAVWTGDDEG